MGGKLLSGIKNMYVSLACVRVKMVRESVSKLKQGCVMSPWLFNMYMNVVIKEVKVGMGRMGVRFMEAERE